MPLLFSRAQCCVSGRWFEWNRLHKGFKKRMLERKEKNEKEEISFVAVLQLFFAA